MLPPAACTFSAATLADSQFLCSEKVEPGVIPDPSPHYISRQ